MGGGGVGASFSNAAAEVLDGALEGELHPGVLVVAVVELLAPDGESEHAFAKPWVQRPRGRQGGVALRELRVAGA